MGWACRLTVEPHQAPAGCDLTQRSPLFAAHLRAPLLVHVRSSLHENRDGFVVLVHGRQAQDRPVLVVTAVGAEGVLCPCSAWCGVPLKGRAGINELEEQGDSF